MGGRQARRLTRLLDEAVGDGPYGKSMGWREWRAGDVRRHPDPEWRASQAHRPAEPGSIAPEVAQDRPKRTEPGSWPVRWAASRPHGAGPRRGWIFRQPSEGRIPRGRSAFMRNPRPGSPRGGAGVRAHPQTRSSASLRSRSADSAARGAAEAVTGVGVGVAADPTAPAGCGRVGGRGAGGGWPAGRNGGCGPVAGAGGANRSAG